MSRRLVVILVCLVASGCAGSRIVPPQPYVAADRQQLTATRGLLEITKRDHPDLATQIDDNLATWELRVTKAEAGIFPAH